MFRKLAILLVFTAPLMAYDDCCFCYRGIDIDIGVGASNYSTYFNNTVSTWQRQIGNTNVAAQAGIGVNVMWNCWVFGVRGFGQYNNAVSTERRRAADGYEMEVKMPWDVGVEGRFGYAWNSSMHFFGTVGGDWGWNHFKEWDIDGSTRFTTNSKKVHTGIRVGAGGEQWLTRCIFIRETFGYTWFEKKSYTTADGDLARISPRLASTLFMLGIVF